MVPLEAGASVEHLEGYCGKRERPDESDQYRFYVHFRVQLVLTMPDLIFYLLLPVRG